LNKFRPGTIKDETVAKIPAWDDERDFPRFGDESWLLALEKCGGVFFSCPLDLDLMLLETYPDAYGVTPATPTEATKEAVLGKARANVDRLDDAHLELFDEYQKQFKRGSKPASHIAAMAELTNEELLEDLPKPLGRLVDAVRKRLESVPE
jgi:putative ATP-dependent endonuclease of OLD family